MVVDNFVQLEGTYGGDMTHAMSAWTSTRRELTEERKKRIKALLVQLAQAEPNAHESPFEKSFIHFVVDVETASHIHILKHRIAVSVNGESARYKELQGDKYYVPRDWPKGLQEALERHCWNSFELYHKVLKDLELQGFDRKRAKESARFFLPYATSIRLDVSFNFRSFIHFQKLRNEKGAQDEIHNVAEQMLNLVRDTGMFDYSLEAFGY